MCIYLRNNPDKFHSEPIWNDKVFGFFEDVRHNNKIKMSSDMRSVPDLKIFKISKILRSYN